MDALETLISHASEIETKLGYTFKDKQLLALAFTHRSFVNENKSLTVQHNERLEFLGDSVLGLIVSEALYLKLPDTPEGELSSLRSRIVESSSCMNYMVQLEAESYLLLGKGEQRNDGRGRDSILADLFEAILGAIYLDGGFEAAKEFISGKFSEVIDGILRKPFTNWKAALQDFSQKNYQEPPQYIVVDEQGPDHSKQFTIAVHLAGHEMGRGIGSSKKEAQQQAAEDAVRRLQSQETQA